MYIDTINSSREARKERNYNTSKGKEGTGQDRTEEERMENEMRGSR